MSRNAKTANRSLDVRHLAKGVCRKKDFSVQLCGISVPPWWNYSEKINHRDTEIAQRSTKFIFPTDSEASDRPCDCKTHMFDPRSPAPLARLILRHVFPGLTPWA